MNMDNFAETHTNQDASPVYNNMTNVKNEMRTPLTQGEWNPYCPPYSTNVETSQSKHLLGSTYETVSNTVTGVYVVPDTHFTGPSTSYIQQNQNQMEDINDGEGMQITQTATGGGACFCGKVFSTYNYCRVHYIQVHGEDTEDKSLICLICKQLFAYDLNLKNHLKKEHSINGKLTLDEGSGGLLAVTDSGGGVCLVCSKKFSTLNYCKVHFRSKHGNVNDNNQDAFQPPALKQKSLDCQAAPSGMFPVTVKTTYVNTSPTHHVKKETIHPYSNQVNNSQMNYAQEHFNNQSNNSGNLNVKEECVPGNEITNFDGNQQSSRAIGFIEHNTGSTQLDQSKMPQKNLKRSFAETSMSIVEGHEVGFKKQLIQGGSPRKSDGGVRISKTTTGGGYCEVCGKMYSRIDTARSHYVQVHGEETGIKNFFCLICNEGFVFELNLSSHLKQTHAIVGKLQLYEGCGGKLAKTESGGGVCLVCGAKYSRMDTLKSHFKTKHEPFITDDPYVSPIKENKFSLPDNSSQYELNEWGDCITTPEREVQHSSNLSSVALAIKQEKRKEEPIQNIQSRTGEPNIQTCDTSIPSMPLIRPVNISMLKARPELHLPNVKQEAGMHNEPTDGGIESQNNQAEIKISETESGGGICLICNMTFSLYGNCKAHYIKKHGEDDGNGKHVCLVCGTTFNFLQNFRDHLKREHGVNGMLTRYQEYGDGYNMAKMGNEGGVCLKCCQVFTLFGNLKAHYSKKHGTVQSVSDHKPTIISNSYSPSIPRQETNYATDRTSNFVAGGSNSIALATTCHATNNPIKPIVQGMNKIKAEPKQYPDLGLQNDAEVQIAKTESGGGVCLVCNLTFSQYGNCKVHYIKKHGEDGTGHLCCLLCQARFNFQSSFKEHMNGKHGVTGTLKRCEEYAEGTMMAKDDNGGGACLICARYFSQFGNLKVHFNKKHANN